MTSVSAIAVRSPVLAALITALSMTALIASSAGCQQPPSTPSPVFPEGRRLTVTTGEYAGLALEIRDARVDEDGITRYIILADGVPLPRLFTNQDIALALGEGLKIVP